MGQKGVWGTRFKNGSDNKKKERSKGKEEDMKRSSSRQLKAMLRKNWLLKIRHPFVTLMEVSP